MGPEATGALLVFAGVALFGGGVGGGCAGFVVSFSLSADQSVEACLFGWVVCGGGVVV